MDSDVKNSRRSSGGVVGRAAINQDGQGVGTEPIYAHADVSIVTDDRQDGAHKTTFLRVDEWLRGEPFPHESAC